jgi:hypothetical protein
MIKTLVILCLVLLASCGPSQEDKENVAAVTCSIMSETRNMDAAVRVREMNDAREKIGGEPFLKGDNAIQEAFEFGLCQELVLGTYDESLQSLQERERLAWEAGAEDRKIAVEKQRIADSKPTVKEEFHSNGKLQSRKNYQSKSDGGKEHGLSEYFHDNGQLESKQNYKDGLVEGGLSESYYSNGKLSAKRNYKDGELDGVFKFYHPENGQLVYKQNYKDGQQDGIAESYYKNELLYKDCYKNDEQIDMSYCEK